MSAQIAAYGRLGGDPAERTTSSGKTMATASLAVDAGRNSDDPPLWLKVVAFGQTGEVLARHGKGDILSVVGRLQVNHWTDREGNAREDLQVVAEQLVSPRAPRPGGRKKTPTTTSRAAAPKSTGLPFIEDEIPFAPEVRI